MSDLIVDNDFKELIPPLADEERKQLEENILRDGIQDALKVWQGILIDGHNRYEIAKRHGLTFTTTEMQFATRDDAKIWIIKNQLGRRNINDYTRGELVTQFKTIIAARAKENQKLSEGRGQKGLSNLINLNAEAQAIQPVNTQKELAEMADVSTGTMAKIEKLVDNATPEIKQALREGELSINAAYEGVKAGAQTVEEVKEKKPHVSFNSGNNEWYTPADIIEGNATHDDLCHSRQGEIARRSFHARRNRLRYDSPRRFATRAYGRSKNYPRPCSRRRTIPLRRTRLENVLQPRQPRRGNRPPCPR